MPPRLSLQPLARQCRSCLSQLTASFSTTAPVAARTYPSSETSRASYDQDITNTSSHFAVRNLSNPTSSVLSLDNDGTPRSPRQPLDATDRVRNLLADSEARRQRMTDRKKSTLERMRAKKTSEDYARQMTRRWRPGDVYAPHDLSPQEMIKWKQLQRPKKDVLDLLGLNPLDEYKVGRFTIEMGDRKWLTQGAELLHHL